MMASMPPPPSRMTRNTSAAGLASASAEPASAPAVVAGVATPADFISSTGNGFSPLHPASKAATTTQELRMRFSFGNSGSNAQEEHDEGNRQQRKQQPHLVARDECRETRLHEAELRCLGLD